MDIVFFRHGEAGRRLEVVDEDVERALTVAGRDEVKEVALSLKNLKLKFDVIATSPLKRSRETAEITAQALGKGKAPEDWEELKPEGNPEALYRRLSKLKRDSSVLLVGHEPYLGNVIGELVAGGRGARIALKKSGVAKLEVTSFDPSPTGELKWLLTPRIARKLAR